MNIMLHSVAIFVTDVPKARNFYETLLGLHVARAGSFGLELLADAPHIAVVPAGHPEAKSLVGRHTGLTFRVEHLIDRCSALGEAGVKFVQEPTQQGFGVMAMVADPDGNILALWEDNTADLQDAS